MHPKAKEYISELSLKRHPEGGYYREIYRSGEILEPVDLFPGYKKDHSLSTSIYFMLEGMQVSMFHKLKSDEIWHFYDGSAVIVYIISKTGKLDTLLLGDNITNSEAFQIVIPRDNWFGAELKDKSSFGLIGCTVSPGFEFEDFELAERKNLLNLFPQHSEIIKKLTKFTD